MRNSSNVSFHENPKSIKCFTCGFLTSVYGFNRLPVNSILLKKMRANNVNSNEMSSTLCNLCSNEVSGPILIIDYNRFWTTPNLKSQAMAFCLRCNLNLCVSCKEDHLRHQNTFSHNISDLLDTRIDEMNGDSNLAHKKCSIHLTMDIKLFCISCYQVSLI